MKELKHDDIKDLSYKDIAYLILERSNKGKNTLELFTEIINLLELPNNYIDLKIADFYTTMTTDKRFLLVDGLWDLRTRHTSDKLLKVTDEEEDEEEISEETEEDLEDETDSYEDDIDDDNSFDDNDDGLSDLVVIDEDEMDLENN